MKNILKKIENITKGFCHKATKTNIKLEELMNRKHNNKKVYEVVRKSKDITWYRSGITTNNVYYEHETGIAWVAHVHL